MEREYKIKKSPFSKEDISYMQIFFNNGEFLEIKKKEICKISLNLSDQLVIIDNQICYDVESGFIKLRIFNSKVKPFDFNNLKNTSEFIKNRKNYIENRCSTEKTLKYLIFFDENNNKNIFAGDIFCKIDGEYLFIEYKNLSKKRKNDNEYTSIVLKDIVKEDIFKMSLDFENCEYIDIFNNEIIDIELKFKENFNSHFYDLKRRVIGGYIKIKFEENDDRNIDLAIEEEPKLSDLENRICGKDGEDYHDICNLYIDFYRDVDGIIKKEHILIDDIRYDGDEIDYNDIEDDNDDIDEYFYEEDYDSFENRWFVGGYAKKNIDGTILITFGEEKEKVL